MKRALLILALGALSAAGFVENADRSLAVFPRQEIPLRFDHAQHLKQDMKCTQCHDVETSRRGSDRNIPPEKSCTDCHDIEAAKKGEVTDPPASCQTCHPGFDATVMARPRADVFPDPNLKFDHALHLKKGVPCKTCHGDLTNVQLATRTQLPKMETCLTCHREGGEASGRCSTCHLESNDGTLVTAFPGTARLVPTLGNPFGVAHGPGYERTHGPDAMASRAICSSCHSEGYCLTCHAGTLKNLKVHPNDWITLHPVPAKQASLECNSCHNYQTFCVNCHAQAGIAKATEVPALAPKGTLTFHPAGWVTGANTHALQASRNISACVSCHREETCLQCHATLARLGGGARVHPPGFRSQASNLCHRNERVCLTCHTATDANIAEACR